MKRLILTLLPLTLWAAAPTKEDPAATQQQIRELQQKIKEYNEKSAAVAQQISVTRSEAAAEQQAHERYRSTFTTELNRLAAERSLLEDQRKTLTRSADSLSQKITVLQGSVKETELRTKAVNTTLLAAIDRYTIELEQVPAPLLQNEKDALKFLRREIAAETIAPAEGIERFWQIVTTVNSGRLTIDSWQGRSLFDSITGQVYYIRIGYGWIGMVNESGTAAALWNGAAWESISSATEITSLRNAVKIRGGNAVPQLLAIPLNPVVQERAQ